LLYIFNPEGKLIYEKKFSTNVNGTSLNLDLKSGLYIIELVNETAFGFSEFLFAKI
jgi:hypothetical protein